MGKRTRISRELKVSVYKELSMDTKKEYDKAGFLIRCKIQKIQKAKAKRRARVLSSKLIPVINRCSGLNISYDF